MKKVLALIAEFLEAVKLFKGLLQEKDEDQPVFSGSKISSGLLDE